MENPQQDIYKVFHLVDSVNSAELQKAAIERFFLPDAGFKYPIFQVNQGPGSRDKILRLYQWLHIISPKVEGVVTHAVYDDSRNILLLDVTQNLNLRYLPFWPTSSKMLTKLTLKKHGGLHYISYQEDFMHLDEVIGLFFPPLKSMMQVALVLSAMILNILAWVTQPLGLFSVKRVREEELKARRRRRRNKNANGANGASDDSHAQGNGQRPEGTSKKDEQADKNSAAIEGGKTSVIIN